jgi:hypothetical protein
MNMEIQYYNKIRWGLAPLAPNDAPPLVMSIIKHHTMNVFVGEWSYTSIHSKLVH